MSEALAEKITFWLGVDLTIGVIFGLLFVFIGLGRIIDPTLKTAPFQAKLMIFFGAVALWPYLLYRVIFMRKAWGIRYGADNFDKDMDENGGL